jgi:hypothetical protein
VRIAMILFATLLWSMIPTKPLRAEDKIENTGVAVGSTVGNLLFVPFKAIAVSMGALTSALSFVVMGGDGELSSQIQRDTLQGPYVITPELARKAIGERPELELE